YRLPTEAEWEYAARAGTETSRYWGNDADDACRYANVADKTAQEKYSNWRIHNCTDGYVYTAPVASFEANPFGLFDMLGNVWEWTCSEYEKKYSGKEQYCLNKSKANDENLFVFRGGSWGFDAGLMRSADRGWRQRANRFGSVGARLARKL
ncbi:MAG: SUMF1/EgtB/PvdO family nonheme iron enzyme, partial [Candidatus Parabeggiatoa sp.]|nr:SUMF1/EgtB/PvdO family nonheme iron enzyme [Candidatus Parabeggiatoa sp.]